MAELGWDQKEPKVCYAELNRGAELNDQIGIGFPCIFDKKGHHMAISESHTPIQDAKDAKDPKNALTGQKKESGLLIRVQTFFRNLQSQQRSFAGDYWCFQREAV